MWGNAEDCFQGPITNISVYGGGNPVTDSTNRYLVFEFEASADVFGLGYNNAHMPTASSFQIPLKEDREFFFELEGLEPYPIEVWKSPTSTYGLNLVPNLYMTAMGETCTRADDFLQVGQCPRIFSIFNVTLHGTYQSSNDGPGNCAPTTAVLAVQRHHGQELAADQRREHAGDWRVPNHRVICKHSLPLVPPSPPSARLLQRHLRSHRTRCTWARSTLSRAGPPSPRRRYVRQSRECPGEQDVHGFRRERRRAVRQAIRLLRA